VASIGFVIKRKDEWLVRLIHCSTFFLEFLFSNEKLSRRIWVNKFSTCIFTLGVECLESCLKDQTLFDSIYIYFCLLFLYRPMASDF